VTFTTDGSHAPGRGTRSSSAATGSATPSTSASPSATSTRLSPHERRRILIDFQTSEYKRAKRLGWRTYKELLGPHDGLCILQGRPVGLVNGTALENAHDNHVHVAR
jgi:hypothetical protein